MNGRVNSRDPDAAPFEQSAQAEALFVSPAGLPTGVVTIGEHAFHVEIAAEVGARERGLMERGALEPDAGMLFVFDAPQYLSFWMLNTYIPLDLAFIREDLIISSVDTMAPLTAAPHVSVEPVAYALEVAAGEFKRRGIGPGDRVTISGLEQEGVREALGFQSPANRGGSWGLILQSSSLL